jgi:hypothetical protein
MSRYQNFLVRFREVQILLLPHQLQLLVQLPQSQPLAQPRIKEAPTKTKTRATTQLQRAQPTNRMIGVPTSLYRVKEERINHSPTVPRRTKVLQRTIRHTPQTSPTKTSRLTRLSEVCFGILRLYVLRPKWFFSIFG